MNRKDIVKKFYEKGVLLSPKELKDLSDRTMASENNSPIPQKEGISANPTNPKKTKKLSTQDFIDYYNNKYEKIKEMLLKKMEVVSITNAKTDPSPCGIIGIVKRLTQAGFIFEDTTGELEVIKSGIKELEEITTDDVFGLKGFVREDKFFPKEIVWPDIPLNHRIGRIKGMDMLLSNNRVPELIISEGQTKDKIQIKKSPERINISRKQNRVTVLAFKTNNTTRDDSLFYLKKRSLPEPNPMKSISPQYIIEEIPDIFWLIQDRQWTETHKGITIISCSGNPPAKLNLETRSVEFEKHQ